MNKLMRWGVLGLAAIGIGIALAGCGSDNSSGNASLRVVNATLTHPSIDLLVNGGVATAGNATDVISGYTSPGAGANVLQINDTTSGTALATSTVSLTGGGHYTLFVYESAGSVKTVTLTEDNATPTTGSSQLRLYNVASDAGKLDVYVTGVNDSLATASSPISFTNGIVPSAQSVTIGAPGTYRIRVTGAGNKADLRADMTGIVIANQQVATFVMSPASGGSLLNGAVLIQQSTYTAQHNTSTRVRLAAAVTGAATISAGATGGTCGTTGCVVDAGSVSPSLGFYAPVPGGAALTINNSSTGTIAVPAGAVLVPGADMTLLVYGPSASPTVSLLQDDNHLPTDTTTVKLSLLNGVTGNPGSLTLTANAALVASGVAPGARSAPIAVAGTTNTTTLKVTSSTAGLIVNEADTLTPGGVYTVFVGGDTTVPTSLQLQLR